MNNFEKFKCLLKWFVTQLKINNNWEKGIPTSGRGCKGEKIRNLYDLWRSYDTFEVDITLQMGFNSNASGANFIHYNEVNINPIFSNNKITELEIRVKENGNQQTIKSYNIADLDLFDNQPPNNNLIDFFEKYEKEVKKFMQNKKFNNDTSQLLLQSNISLNTILYGPPGTGKTYNTAIYAVAICKENGNLDKVKADAKKDYNAVYQKYQKLIDEGRVVFTTFHQSYGYEDFIEGIKPKIDDSTGKKDVYYEDEDGVFKTFCKKNTWFEIVWNQLVADATDNNGIITVTWDAKKNSPGMRDLKYLKKTEDTGYAFYDVFNETTKDHKATKNQVQSILEGTEEKPKNGNLASYKISCAVLKKLKSDYSFEENKVFIIDEINRGNISKIFGELITLIEDDKRGIAKVTLPYSGEDFTVPKNVYILGTMNTADRSIALMDTALRRRFTFEEMMPAPELLKDVGDISTSTLLKTINERIEYLYDREHTIGHAYFKECINDNADINTLRLIFKNKIIPLLQEYFYDDYEKISLVLGDSDDKLKFVKTKTPPKGLGDNGEVKFDLNNEIWDSKKVNNDAFATRLKQIYED